MTSLIDDDRAFDVREGFASKWLTQDPSNSPTLDPPTDPVQDSCVRCGYCLIGLTDEHQCPECGLAIEISRHRPLLRYFDRSWMIAVKRGATLASWCAFGFLAFGVVLVLSDTTEVGRSGPSFFIATATWIGLCVCGFLLGAWFFSRSSPWLPRSACLHARQTRWLLRALLMIVAGMVLARFFAPLRGAIGSIFPWVAYGIGLLGFLVVERSCALASALKRQTVTASTSGLTLSRFLLTVFVVGSVLLGFGIQDRKLSGLIHMACTISMFLFPPVLALSFNGFKRAVALEWRNRPPPVATQPAGPEIGPSAT